MKFYIALTFVLLTTKLCAQKDLLFKKVKLSDSLGLICLTDYLDSLQQNKRFSFYCNSQNEVTDIFQTFKVGKIVPQIGESKEVHIYILKGKEIQQIQIVINPRYQNVNTDVLGEFNYYFFDTTQLLDAHKKYPISYKAKWLTFDTKQQFDNFIQTHNSDSTFLCYEDNTLEYPGSGIIYVKKDKDINTSPKAEKLLENAFKRLTPNEDDYSIGLLFDEGNVSQYKYEIECSKELFDKVNNAKFIKGRWIQNKFELLTYWRD